jgi:hypothetical protein
MLSMLVPGLPPQRSSTATVLSTSALHLPCRAAEAAQQRIGVAVSPVYLSLNPATDRPEALKRVVQASGHPALVALTGDADGVGPCVCACVCGGGRAGQGFVGGNATR